MDQSYSIRTTSPRSAVQNISVSNASDLVAAFNNMTNVGDRIELFFAVAETNPEVALKSFITILNTHAGQPLRALALRGLGRIGDPATKQEIMACQSEYSQELLKILADEVNGKGSYGSDLTRWAAAEAIMLIGYELDHVQHTALGGLVEPPRRIANEIIQKNVKSIYPTHIASGELIPNYERFLEFWAYGATEFYFESPESSRYHLQDILNLLQIRGIELGLQSSQISTQEVSYTFAQSLFREYLRTEDSYLGESLKRFLKRNFSDNKSLLDLANATVFEYRYTQIGYFELAKKYKRCHNNTETLEEMSDREVKFFQRNKINEIREFKNSSGSELKAEKLTSQEQIDRVNSLFPAAISVCDNSHLLTILRSNQENYAGYEKSWVGQVQDSIEALTNLQDKIRKNQTLINSTYRELRENFRGDFYRDFRNLKGQEYKASNRWETFNDSTFLLSQLNELNCSMIDRFNKMNVNSFSFTMLLLLILVTGTILLMSIANYHLLGGWLFLMTITVGSFSICVSSAVIVEVLTLLDYKPTANVLVCFLLSSGMILVLCTFRNLNIIGFWLSIPAFIGHLALILSVILIPSKVIRDKLNILLENVAEKQVKNWKN